MSDLRFSGLPAGQADVTLRQGGQTASLSVQVPSEPLAAENNCYYLSNTPSARNWQGMSVTMGSVEGVTEGFAPPVFREVLQTEAGHANRVLSSEFRDSTYTPKVYLGGVADVYRIEDGEMKEIRQSRIIGGNWGNWHRRAMVSSPGFNWDFRDWNGRGNRYWFSVAALDGGNLIGARAIAAYDLPADAPRASSVSNANAANFNWEEGGGLPAPTGFTITPSPENASVLSLSWDPVPDAAGYVVFIAFSDPALFVADRHLELEDDGGPPLLPGDMVILSNRITEPQIDMKSTRVYGDGGSSFPLIYRFLRNPMNEPGHALTSSLGDWTEADPAPAPGLGTSYARIQVVAGTGPAEVMHQWWSGSAEQTWYPVPKPDQLYRWSAWIEVDRAVNIRFRFGLEGVPDAERTLAPGWQKVVFEGSATETRMTSSQILYWSLRVMDRASPLQMRVAAIRYHDVATPYQQISEKFESLVPPGMFLRDHSLIKPGQRTADVASLTNPPGESGGRYGSSVEGFLRMAEAAGGQPWLQIEWYHTEQDWLDILAYLAAPVSSGHPMALKRQSNGRTEPWTQAFDQIRLEFGNESWNSLAEFWNIPGGMTDAVTGHTYNHGAVFGLMCRRAAQAMRASPFWDDKIKFVLGGWARTTYSFEIAETFGLPVEVGIANYNGGWDEGNVIVSENFASYQNTVATVPAATGAAIEHLVDGLEQLAQTPGFPLTFGEDLLPTCYEAGPGYQMNGLNGAQVTAEEAIVQEVVMKSRAAATGTLDTMMYQALQGFALFNFFNLMEGDRWASHAPDIMGGGVYPTYELCRLVMEQMGPSEVYGLTELRPDSLEILSRGGELIAPSAGFVYGLRSKADPRRFMFVLGNRDLAKPLPMSVFSTLRSCDALTAWGNLGHYTEHNRYPVGYRMSAEGPLVPDPKSVDIQFPAHSLPVPADPARIDIDSSLGLAGVEAGLPPGGALLLRLDGAIFQGE